MFFEPHISLKGVSVKIKVYLV